MLSTMNNENDSRVVVKQLKLLSIDNAITDSEETKPIRQYSLSDLIPVDDLAFHFLQAEKINNGIPAWIPDKNVLLYLNDFVQAKRIKLSDKDENLNSSKPSNTSCQELNAKSGIGSGKEYHTSLAAKDTIADDLKYRIQEATINWRIEVAGADVEPKRNGKRNRDLWDQCGFEV